MGTPQKEKTMSSRLLTMKFMQRAAASSPHSSQESPDGRAAKRQRVSDSHRADDRGSDYQAVQAALAAEELKRTKALERQAIDAGDTKWALNFKNTNDNVDAPRFTIAAAGYSTIDTRKSLDQVVKQDSGDGDSNTFERTTGMTGRKSFGNFKATTEDPQEAGKSRSSAADTSSEETEEEEEGLDSRSQTGERKRKSGRQRDDDTMPRSELSRKRRGEDSANGSPKAKERRKHGEIRLDKLTSISGGGASAPGSSTGPKKCFSCGSIKHKKKDCPARGN